MNLNKKLLSFITHYVGIYNTSLWEYNDLYVQDLDRRDDTCETISLSECELDTTCELYKNKKCVNKTRIKTFTEGNVIIDKNKNEYVLIEYIYARYHPRETEMTHSSQSDMPPLFREDNLTEIFTCCIYQQRKTDDIYLAFSTGRIKYDIYNDVASVKFISSVLHYIQSQAWTSNVILCGHSQGCVMAQYIGLQLMKENLFTSKLWIVGSGPFHWIHKEDIELFESYRKNIAILVLRCQLDKYQTCDTFSVKIRSLSSDLAELPVQTMYYVNVELIDPPPQTNKKVYLSNLSNLSFLNVRNPNTNEIKTISLIPYVEYNIDSMDYQQYYVYPKKYSIRLHNWSSYRFILDQWLGQSEPEPEPESKFRSTPKMDKSLLRDQRSLFGNLHIGGKSRKTRHKYNRQRRTTKKTIMCQKN